ncbi:hypothetical protein ElyMa_004769400 [Elysia marginata]|uniref:Uncharacterized protein n=1 Tax=Elysia marginata TaxID=1093978 RepID=A0AAV4IJL4_9GAST|nr:hypothetical protein ElyMa_004769400 [Elysia marginata]
MSEILTPCITTDSAGCASCMSQSYAVHRGIFLDQKTSKKMMFNIKFVGGAIRANFSHSRSRVDCEINRQLEGGDILPLSLSSSLASCLMSQAAPIDFLELDQSDKIKGDYEDEYLL